MLEQLNMGRLLSQGMGSEDSLSTIASTENSIVFDLMTFTLRYYEGLDYEDFGLDQANVKRLKAEEIKRIWLTIDMLVGKLEESGSKFRSRNVRVF